MNRPGKQFLLLWAGVTLTLFFARWGFYCSSPTHETGDAALNAIQIDRAKHFAELHGNYSRFRFHHPGPAFFYVYAAAEKVLCDWLPTRLTPANAHAVAGLALQAAFFALGVTLAARWITTRLFVPTLLLAAALHLALAGNAFWSIWPPHVLLMPFFAFWIACVSLACGRREDLPWVLLCGCFLVHGHVAQPLYVGTLSGLAYVATWRRDGAPWRATRPHAVAAAILALFLVPLVLDACRGPESNFAEIFRHLRDNSEQLKKPLKSLLYLLSFFGYVRDQDAVLKELSVASLGMFREHWPAFAAWAALLAASTLAWRRLAAHEAAHRRFWRTAALFWIATLGLSFVWGLVQTGRMFEFNMYFFHAVSLLGLLPLLAWLGARPTPTAARRLAPVIFAVAALAGGAAFHRGPLNADEAGRQRLAAVEAALARPADPARPRLLVFTHDQWPNAAAVALALHRGGQPYFVEEAWTFMHPGRIVPAAWLAADEPPLTVWRVVPSGTSPNEIPLDAGGALLIGPQSLAPPVDLPFIHDRAAAYVVAGLIHDPARSPRAWLSQPDAIIQFRAPSSTHDIELVLPVVPRLPGGMPMPPLAIHFDGQLVQRIVVTARQTLRVRLDRKAWNARTTHVLRLHLPGARNPDEPALPRSWDGPSLAVDAIGFFPVP